MTEKFIVSLVKSRKRKGRGIGSGRGKTCGRGTKGQKARKSGQVRPGFEGGQTPIYRRLPKIGFFHQHKEFEIINLQTFEEDQTIVDEQVIDFSSSKKRVKILAKGELTKVLTIRAHSFSLTAREKVEKLGGKIVQI